MVTCGVRTRETLPGAPARSRKFRKVPRDKRAQSRFRGSAVRTRRSRLAYTVVALILHLDLRFEFFGEQRLRACNNHAIAAGKASRYKPSARGGTRQRKLTAFKPCRRDLHIRPRAILSPDNCCLGNHDSRHRSAGRLELSADCVAGAKGRSIRLDYQHEALALKMRINGRREPDRACDQGVIVKTQRRDPRLCWLLCKRLTRRQRYSHECGDPFRERADQPSALARRHRRDLCTPLIGNPQIQQVELCLISLELRPRSFEVLARNILLF